LRRLLATVKRRSDRIGHRHGVGGGHKIMSGRLAEFAG
jgi:hypothetical protein